MHVVEAKIAFFNVLHPLGRPYALGSYLWVLNLSHFACLFGAASSLLSTSYSR
jgi:hypothetical protein